ARKAERFDEVELVGNLCVGLLRAWFVGAAIPPLCTLHRDAPQELHLVQSIGTRIGRQLRRDEVKVERALESERGGAIDDTWIPAEAARLFVTGPQMGGRRCGQPAVDLVEA